MKNRKKIIKNFVLYSLFICVLSLLLYSYYKRNNKFNTLDKNEFFSENLSIIDPSITNFKLPYNQKTPRNLFISFFLTAPSLLRNHYKHYYDLLECISETEDIRSTEIGYIQFINIEKLFTALVATSFKLSDIPSSVSPTTKSMEIILGKDWNKQTFYIAQKESCDWYFTERNFNDPKTIEKFILLQKTSHQFSQEQNVPLIAFSLFMFGANNEFDLTLQNAKNFIDLSWIPIAIREEYGNFIIYVMSKVLMTVKVSATEIPGLSPENYNTIVLYVSPLTHDAICMEKQYYGKNKEKHKWIFPEWSQRNALNMYLNNTMITNINDPFWFKVNHNLWEIFSIFPKNKYRIIYYSILISFFSLLILYFTYKIACFLINLILKFFNHLTDNKGLKYPKRLEVFAALIISLYVGGYFFMNSIIIYMQVYLYFYYIYQIFFWIILIFLLIELTNTLFLYIISFYRKFNDGKKTARLSFALSIIKRIINLTIVIVSIGCILHIHIIDFDMVHFFTALGIGGIAVALACKDTIENLFGSIMLAMSRPFRIGDWIIVSSAEGTVEHISLRSTKIRAFDDSILIVPNYTFITAEIKNMGERVQRRFKTTLDIEYSTPLKLVTKYIDGIYKIIEDTSYISKKEYYIKINDVGSYSFKLLIYVFFLASNWEEELKQREEFIMNIVSLAEKMNIKFAYPVQTLFIDKNKPKEELSDSKKQCLITSNAKSKKTSRKKFTIEQ